jgi:DNA-binding NtrC family response regulator
MPHTALALGNTNEIAVISEYLENAGFSVEVVSETPAASERARLQALAPVLLVVGVQGYQADIGPLSELSSALHCEVILVGDHISQARFSHLIERGMAMYLRLPLDDDFVTELFKDIFQDAEAASRKKKRRQQPVAMDQFGPLYGSSAPMQEMYRFLRKAAASEAVLCIYGESGTGKELVARAVHAYSAHSDEPFEAINCAAIPTDLVESELFGHEKGSFSGAVSEHVGIFQRVGKGTLLLDEITEMPKAIQVKLLRVLESGHFRRVGGEVDCSYQARVIAATNRDPHEAVASGQLREDLFYRLSQLEVRVPSLRERGQDIVDLSRLFVARFDQENDRRLRLSKDAEKLLSNYRWPGNVRQLWNVIQKACTTSREVIRANDLPLEHDAVATGSEADGGITLPPDCSLREAEELIISACITRLGGDKSRAADQLGISLRTLYSRLERYKHSASD